MASAILPIQYGFFKDFFNLAGANIDANDYPMDEQYFSGMKRTAIPVKARPGLVTTTIQIKLIAQLSNTHATETAVGDGLNILDTTIDNFKWREQAGDTIYDVYGKDIRSISNLIGWDPVDRWEDIPADSSKTFSVSATVPFMSNRTLLFDMKAAEALLTSHFSGGNVQVDNARLKIIVNYSNPAGATRRFSFHNAAFEASIGKNPLRLPEDSHRIMGILIKKPKTAVIDDVMIWEGKTNVINNDIDGLDPFITRAEYVALFHRSIPTPEYKATIEYLEAAETLDYTICYDLGVMSAVNIPPQVPAVNPEQTSNLAGTAYNKPITEEGQAAQAAAAASTTPLMDMWRNFVQQMIAQYGPQSQQAQTAQAQMAAAAASQTNSLKTPTAAAAINSSSKAARRAARRSSL